MTKTTYIHYPDRPKSLTASFVAKEYAKLLSRLETAEAATTADLWIKLFGDWNSLASYIGSEASRVSYAYAKDVTNKSLESKDEYFRNKIVPVITKPEHELTSAFLKSKHRQALASRYGEQLIPVYETALKPMDPINTKLGIEASNLTNKYDKIIAKGNVKIQGKEVNLYTARSFLFSDNADTRREAYIASSEWFLKNHDQLAEIYDKLVGIRTQMGKNLGFTNYVPLAYQIRGRQGYGENEVTKFRKAVQKYLTPLVKDVLDKRASQLGTNGLKPWDIFYDPALTIPLGIVPVATQLDSAQRLFDKLSPVLGNHFKQMRREGLIDLETRPNKRAGAFCTEFSDEQKVAILCNSTNDADDVRTLTHEMGHAFQGLESLHIEAVDLQWGSFELAEVYSMGMEFLSLPYMTEFFDKTNADKFAKYKWIDSVFTTCYVCVVDEFQHYVYKHPEATKKERDSQWIKIYDKYLPSINFEGYEKFQATRWYGQGHIFNAPFYYIDYGLAEICAMQFGILNTKNHRKTVNLYLKMCRLGGTMSFIDTLKYSGFAPPFNDKTIRHVADYIREQLI